MYHDFNGDWYHCEKPKSDIVTVDCCSRVEFCMVAIFFL
jgi:hypothetical protein